MSNHFNEIRGLVQQGKIISESQLVFFVSAFAEQQRGAADLSQDNDKPYTIIWYDHDKERSFMIHTQAANSIEAISRHQDDIPLTANVSAYPNHLPSELRYVPDSLLEPS